MLILTLDYDTGWDWANYTYQGFWMPAGFVRNLFFNGWHPVVPRLRFLLFGIALGRLRLDEARIQSRLILFGALAFVAAQTASWFLLPRLSALSPDLAALATTAPVPPMPLFTLAGMGASIFVIGTCLRLSEWLERVGLLVIVTPAGRQTLTLYVAHVLVGMGTLEATGMLGEQSIGTAVFAALVFCMLATVYALLWSTRFKRGPLKALMRQVAG